MLKRPLFVSFLFLALGIITGAYFLEHHILIGALVFMLTSICLFLHMPGKASILFIVFYIFGVFSSQSAFQNPNYYIHRLAQQNEVFLIDGEITASTFTRNGRQRLTINATRFETEDFVFYENIRINAILPLDMEAPFASVIRISGTLGIPELPSTPGAFNSFMFSRSRGFFYTVFPRDFEVLSYGSGARVFLNDIRENIITVFENNLPEQHSALARSMVLGDRTGIDQETIDAYRAAGIYHVLVISGLHITILLLFVYKFLNFFINRNISALIAFLFIISYGTMIGFSVSVFRAILMAGVFILAELFHKERDLLTTASLAAIIMLIVHPLYLFDIGSQLSFGAVFGIALFNKPMQNLLKKILLLLKIDPKKFKTIQDSITIDIAITIALTPIFAFHFYRVNPYSLFGNIAITFTTVIVIILAFLLALVGLILEPLAFIFVGAVYLLLSFHMFIAMFFYEMPGSFFLVGSPPVALIIIYYSFILSIVYFSKKKLVSFVFTVVFGLFLLGQDTSPSISFMDVGQGKSTIITYSGNTIIIDGGGPWGRPVGNSTGINVLIPYLEFHGINFIDKIFLTHDSMDHIVGIIELVGNKRIGAIYTTIGLDREVFFANMLIERAEYYNVPIYFIYGPQRFNFDGLFIDLLHPTLSTNFRTANQTSLVFRVVYGDTAFLLASDIDKESEREIIASGVLLSSNVLQVAHQGSRNSSYEGFLRSVNPTYAVISAGRGNVHGHPHTETLYRLRRENIIYLKTFNKGTITFRTNGYEIKLQ